METLKENVFDIIEDNLKDLELSISRLRNLWLEAVAALEAVLAHDRGKLDRDRESGGRDKHLRSKQNLELIDVPGIGRTFAFEDWRVDVDSDKDYSHYAFSLSSATFGKVSIDFLFDGGAYQGEVAMQQIIAKPDSAIAELTDDPLSDVGVLAGKYEFPKANQPSVEIIDTGFFDKNPDIDYSSRIILGRHLIDNDNNPLLAANGKWYEYLIEFVDAAKASKQPNAIVNLSFDLTEIKPDSTVVTRTEFTPAEKAAIEYARQNNVLIVAVAGNEGEANISALGKASREFDNIITVGAFVRVNLESGRATDGWGGNDIIFHVEGKDNISTIENVVGSRFNDELIGDDNPNLITADSGDDVLKGGGGDDKLYGEKGNDNISGGFGNDSLYGNEGKDLINGDEGKDYIRGGDGDDEIYAGSGIFVMCDLPDIILFGGAGNDFISGGEGNDTLIAGEGNDKLWGGENDDLLLAEAGNDYLAGGEGNDSLIAGEGNDSLYGQGDDNYLAGGMGSDRIFGNEGDDELFGQVGDDYLDGGAGNDILIFYTGYCGVGVLPASEFIDLLQNISNRLFENEDGNDFSKGNEGNDILKSQKCSIRILLNQQKMSIFPATVAGKSNYLAKFSEQEHHYKRQFLPLTPIISNNKFSPALVSTCLLTVALQQTCAACLFTEIYIIKGFQIRVAPVSIVATTTESYKTQRQLASDKDATASLIHLLTINTSLLEEVIRGMSFVAIMTKLSISALGAFKVCSASPDRAPPLIHKDSRFEVA